MQVAYRKCRLCPQLLKPGMHYAYSLDTLMTGTTHYYRHMPLHTRSDASSAPANFLLRDVSQRQWGDAWRSHCQQERQVRKHRDLAAAPDFAVQRIHCVLRITLIRKLDEAEATRPPAKHRALAQPHAEHMQCSDLIAAEVQWPALKLRCRSSIWDAFVKPMVSEGGLKLALRAQRC